MTWWDYFGYSPTADKAVNDLIARYEKEHPEIRIKRTSIGFADFHAKIVQAAAAGTFPDIAAIDSPDVPLLASQRAISDVTAKFDAWSLGGQFLERVRESVRYEGRYYGAPLRSNTTALIYNKAVFTGQPPTTWTELQAAAKANTTAERAGLCFAAAANEQLTFNFLPFVWQAGGDLKTVGDPATVDALDYVNRLVSEDKSVPRQVLQWGHSDVEKQFTAGRCAMMINGPWVIPGLKKAGLNWGAAPLAKGRQHASPLGGEVWVVGAKTKNLDASWNVLTWLAEHKDNAGEFGGGLGSVPNRVDTLNDPAWQWDPAVAAFAGQMTNARPRSVYGPQYPQLSEAVWTMAQQVLTGAKSPSEAAADAKTRIQPLLGR